jgi:amino acid permease
MIILVIYIYGAMCLKYASGAASFVSGVSSTIYDGDQNKWTKVSSVDPYYFSILIFAFLSLIFCFGNIENSKGL